METKELSTSPYTTWWHWELVLWNNPKYGKYDIPYAYAAENTIFQDLVPGKVE